MHDKWNDAEFCKEKYFAISKIIQHIYHLRKYFSSKNVPINYLASKSFTLLMEHHCIEGEICKWQKEN